MKPFVYILFFLPFLQLSAQQINISGTVTDLDFSSPLENTFVVVKDNITSEILGTDTTDNNGNYIITFIIDKVNDPSLPEDYYLSNPFPNPHNPSTNLLFSTPISGSYTVSIYNIIGERIYLREFNFKAGSYNLNISGLGSAGVYLFNISGEEFSQAQKMILADGREGNVKVILSSGSYLSKTMDNELLVEFRRNGYEDKDTVINLSQSITLNAELIQIPTNTSFNFHSEFTLSPTGHVGENLTVTELQGYFGGVTNTSGIFDTQVNATYIFDPLNQSNIQWTPEELNVIVNGQNVQQKDTSLVVNGDDLSWITTVIQIPIQKQAYAFGAVTDEVGGLGNALVKFFDAGTNEFKDSTRSLSNGFWESEYYYQGYEYDPNDLFALIDSVRFEFSAFEHYDFDTTATFINVLEINAFLPHIPVQPYVFSATINLRKTFKGEIVTDLDTIWIDWNNSSNPNYYLANNGVVHVYKELLTLNSDTTAQLYHERPDLYLKWMVGHRINPNKPDWIFQNPSRTENSIMPMNVVNQEGVIDVIMVPKTTMGGWNNNEIITMDDPSIVGLWNRVLSAYVSSFMESPAGYNPVNIIQATFNETTGEPVDSVHINRSLGELTKYLNATHWTNRNLLNYAIDFINSYNDSLWQQIINPPRNYDNFYLVVFQFGTPGNGLVIAADGTFRIKFGFSKYGETHSWQLMQEEIFASMSNIEFDGPSLVVQSTGEFNDLAHNLIGIAYMFKKGKVY